MAQTVQDKAANRAARTVRDRAYRARRREYSQALHAAEHSPAVLAAEARCRVLDERLEAAIARRRAEQDALRQQIKAIEAQIERLNDLAEVQEARLAASHAIARWNSLKDQAREAVERMFPDMQGGAAWSAASWKPPQAVLEEAEAARRAVIEGGSADDGVSAEG